MEFKFNPCMLMGRISQQNNFYRYYGVSDNPHADKNIRYDSGVFFVFRTKSNSIQLKYKCHFHSNYIRSSKKNKVECTVLGFNQKNNRWDYLNELNGFYPYECNSDTDWITTSIVDLSNRKFDKFQVCLPQEGIITDLIILSDEPVEFAHKRPQIVLIRSSIACTSNDCSHMRIPPYMYRKYGMSVASIGISKYHTFHNMNLMKEISSDKYSDMTFVVMDLEHVSNDQYKSVRQILNKQNFKFAVIDSAHTNTCRRLSSIYPEINSFIPPCDWLCDCRHLNDYGVVEYSKLLVNITKI